ncbi:response regulator transcription factor [Paenibacillus macerans]|uniref:response regulator transcription factor n=1 Tax=Paenibacillus macerans TaxID=44252 RepID=UPI003D30F959
MYNVIIVEDSKPILRNIRTLLNSLELPVSVVATAANGEEALELIREGPVDLLLTDIRMPKMDGLTLIEQAKRIRPKLLFVLISGYNDFEYTRKAINLQVFDYLLKPVERKQLAEVMDRAIERLSRQTPSEAEMFREIVDPRYYPEMQLGDHFRHYDKMILLLRKQPFADREDLWKQEVIQRELSAFFAPHLSWVFPTQQPGQFLAMVHKASADACSSVLEYLESVRRYLDNLGIRSAIGGQLPSGDPGRLPELYYRMSGILNEQQRIAHGIVVDTEVPLPLASQDSRSMDRAVTAGFIELIRGRRKEQFLLKLGEQLAKWHGENVRLAELERFVGQMADAFGQTGAAGQDAGFRLDLEAASKRLFDRDSYADFGQALQEWARECFEQLQSQNRKGAEELFKQIEEYVQLNLYSYLSIADVALKFHVSPSYVSRIMKKYAQSTFVQYYTQLKIKEACRLMAGKPEMKFKEVSDALSFSDQHYFSKVFKEYTGYSPTEYKERVLATPTKESDGGG